MEVIDNNKRAVSKGDQIGYTRNVPDRAKKKGSSIVGLSK